MVTIWRSLRTFSHDLVHVLVALGVAALAFLAVVSVPVVGFVIFAWLSTTTNEWPHPRVSAMRERVELLLPPPPTATFVNATITTYFDGDQWRCVEYKTEASEQETNAYYDRAKQQMWWGANDGYGFDGPDLILPVPSIVAYVSVTPWSAAASPANRISVCYPYEFMRWPKQFTRPDMIVSWPHPEVVAWREQVEQAYPPDPAWSFIGAAMITRPNGYHWDCMTYRTGLSASDGRAYYDRWLPGGSAPRRTTPPYLLPARMKSTDGTVTICPFFQ